MPKPYHTPKSERDEVLGALEEAEGLDLAEVRRLARERARSIRLRREHGRERGPGRKAAPSLRLEVEA